MESTDGAPVPEFALNSTRYRHSAYKVVAAFALNAVPLSYRVPEPLAVVFQPEKVNPVRAKVPWVRVNDCPNGITVFPCGEPDVAPFGSRVTAAPHCA